MQKWVGAALAGLTAVALAAAAALGAFSGSHRAAAPPANADNVTLHGRWEITVRRPDGALVTRRRFHNDLAVNGKVLLRDLLAGAHAPGLWLVDVDLFHTADSPCTSAGNGAVCVTVESASTLAATEFRFKTLTTSSELDASAVPALVLRSQFTATRDGQVKDVVSAAQSCAPGAAPHVDCGAGYPVFTQRDLTSTPVAVTGGQIVQLKVTLTFS
jgi:hypothetical protein